MPGRPARGYGSRVRVVGFEATELRALCDELERPLKAGLLVCVPTSSGYAVVASTYSAQARSTLRQLREVGEDVALQVLIPIGSMMGAFATVTDSARIIARAFWPGMVSVLLDSDTRELAGTQVLLRHPQEPLLEQLTMQVGPLFASRAVLGGVEIGSREDLRSLESSRRIRVFVDAGPLSANGRSTIVDCRSDPPVVRREGTVGVADIRSLIPSLVTNESKAAVVDTATRE